MYKLVVNVFMSTFVKFNPYSVILLRIKLSKMTYFLKYAIHLNGTVFLVVIGEEQMLQEEFKCIQPGKLDLKYFTLA